MKILPSVNRGRSSRRLLLALLLSAAFCNGCRTAGPHAEHLPPAPDYTDNGQWFTVERGAAVDLFYIVSTETNDYTTGDNLPCHYADTYLESRRSPLRDEMAGADRLLAGGLNFYAPYYRQCTMESFVSDSLARARTALPLNDLRRAFRTYIDSLSAGRPFILMGFSQGAIGVVQLLKEMDSATYSRMVAAYVVGWKVTGDDLTAPFLRPARDSADIGVTVCYNSVRNPDCAIPLISEGNLLAINPVNWRTDATPATLVSPASDDTLTVTLDTANHLLLVDGYSRQDYLLPLIGREGNYHGLEILLYCSQLRRNLALRAAAFDAQQ
ncbi:MAG: hypothetical protein AUK63_397 [bacterium P3]|nr:MAG: hypothetical protein AUK63_397 [bacterium P3]KWW42643.1 MAG: hypothetical protein F083_47 [bacterium F083]